MYGKPETLISCVDCICTRWELDWQGRIQEYFEVGEGEKTDT